MTGVIKAKVLNDMADAIITAPKPMQCGDFAAGVAWAVRAMREAAVSAVEEDRIGFEAPCEGCDGTVWVELEDDPDNRRKAFMCTGCFSPNMDDTPPF